MGNYLNKIDLLHEKGAEDEASRMFKAICTQLSRDVAKVCKSAQSGHLGGSLSSVELLSTLYLGGHLRYCLDNPKHNDRDRVLLRGHLGPLRYPLFSTLGWIKRDELLTYRRLNSRLHGHESMNDTPGVDITPSGSLGMILSYGVGASIVSRGSAHKFNTYVFLGDGEEQEGNISEAARHAANLKLDNLICILDKNGKQLSRPTDDFNSMSDVAAIWKGYGWNVINVQNGHDPIAISDAYTKAEAYDKGPTLIIARTNKGNGLMEGDENFCGYHTLSNCPDGIVEEFIQRKERELKELGVSVNDMKKAIRSAAAKIDVDESAREEGLFEKIDSRIVKNTKQRVSVVNYYRQLSNNIETGKTKNFYFLTADLMPKNEIKDCGLQKVENFYDVGLREQHMYAMAHGISVTDRDTRIHISASEAFSYRALDQLNALGQGNSKVVIIADRAGISNGKNGASHQSVGQPFALLCQPNTTFLEPSDNEDFYSCLNKAFTENDSLYYIRGHSLYCPNLPKKNFVKDEINPFFEVGDEENPDITLVGSGITTAYLWDAVPELREKGIKARLVNITAPGMLGKDFAETMAGDRPCFCLYNGHPDFLPAAVSKAVGYDSDNCPSMMEGHGFTIGTTGTIEELVVHFGFDRRSIVDKVSTLCREHRMRNRLKKYQLRNEPASSIYFPIVFNYKHI